VWTGLATVGLHGAALLMDPKIGFGLGAVLVPFASHWRPAAVAAGVVAGWLALVLAASFPMRKVICRRGWRALHYAGFAAFLLALVHALSSGTDLAGLGGPLVAAVAGGPVLCLTLVRILTPPKPVPARTPVGRAQSSPS